LARRDAISYTAERLAMAPRQVYEAVERAKRGREGR
jgi:predicted transcriptional regulator YheO